MPINPVMPDNAAIEATETGADEQAQAPIAEPPTPEPPPPPPPEAPEPEPEGETDLDADKEAPGEDDRASEAGKELAARKRGLEGRKQTIQESINALVRERGEITRETERGRQERAELQREIEALRGERQRATGGPPPPGQAGAYDGTDPQDPKPVEATFSDYSQFVEAVGDWAGRKAWRRGEYLRHQRETMSARQQWETTRAQNYSTRYQAFAKENPTFEQEINREDLLLTAPMVDVVKDSEVGPSILLHLSRHPEDIDRISRLHPVLAFGEMKKIEARLEGAHSGSPQPTQQHSKAPAPIKPVGNVGSRRSDSDEIPGEDVNEDEHIRRMNQRDEMLRKRGVNIRKGYGVRV